MRRFLCSVFMVSVFALLWFNPAVTLGIAIDQLSRVTDTRADAGSADAPVRDVDRFDYYVMRMVWTPALCATDAEADACDDPDGFRLESFVPTFEAGAQVYCLENSKPPLRREADAMSDVMRSGDWAWHQWKKHGSCSGLEGGDYYRTARRAFESIARPASLEGLETEVEVPLSAITDTMLLLNPALPRDGLAVSCQSGRMQEVVVCLDRMLFPRACSRAVRDTCSAEMVSIAAPG